jgi:hypothetical protein
MAEPYKGTSLLDGLARHEMHRHDLTEALVELAKSCDREGIAFAVVGALALQRHGYVRFTEDIDIVTTREGLDRVHAALIGRGFMARGVGLRKKLRDTIHKVNIDIITAGEHAGAADSPLAYPPPDDAAYGHVDRGVRYATLEALIAFKLTSGIWGKRPKDFVDVTELIKANTLDEGWADTLIPELRAKFRELVAASREELELPE